MTTEDRSKSTALVTSELKHILQTLPRGLESKNASSSEAEVSAGAPVMPSRTAAPSAAVGNSIGRILRLVLVAGVLALVAWLLIRIVVPDFFVASTMRDLSTVVDINPWLSKLLEVLLYFLAFAVVGAFMSFSGTKQRNAVLASVAGFTTIYGSAWFLTRDVWFDKDGNSLKCYVITHQGVQLFDTKRFDPKTGQKCQPISQQMAPALQRLVDHQKKSEPVSPVDPASVAAFSQRTGEPLLWYVERENGEVLFYDVPGFDRDSSKPFKQVTPEYWRAAQRRLNTPKIGDTRLITRVISARGPEGGVSTELPAGVSVVVDGIDGESVYVRDGDRPWKVRFSDLSNSSRRVAK